MRIEPHENLTVTLIRRHQFGSDRLAGSVPREAVAAAGPPPQPPCDKVECGKDDIQPFCDLLEPVGPADVIPPTENQPVGEATESPLAPMPIYMPAGQAVGNLLDVMA